MKRQVQTIQGELMRPFARSPIQRRAMRVAVASWLATAATPPLDAQLPVPTVGVREEIRIQSTDSVPGMLLAGVEDLAVLPDGRIVTTHRREQVVRVFDPNGSLIKVVGRRGDGPGEFRSIRQVGYVGNRIWVEDLGWYQLFDARTYEPVGRVPRGPTSGHFQGLTSDSTSFHYTGNGDSARVSIYDRTGEQRMPIDLALRVAGHTFQVPWAESAPGGFLTGRTVQQTRYSPLVTGTRPRLIPGGREIVVLEASELWNGPPGQFTIRRIDTQTRRISPPVTASLPVRRVTPAEADSLIKTFAPPVNSPRDARTREAYIAKAKVPATYPAFMSYTPSADGVLWLAEYARPHTRLVIDLAGKPLMRVQLPTGLRVIAVSRTHLWGVTQDADDLPIIARYRVLR